jgi:hypothetical protein
MIITEVGMHSDVKALVYAAAFQPDVGESVDTPAAKMPAPSKSIGPVGNFFSNQLRRVSERFRRRRSRVGRINPDLETIELVGSHVIFLLHAGKVAALIEKAAAAAK